ARVQLQFPAQLAAGELAAREPGEQPELDGGQQDLRREEPEGGLQDGGGGDGGSGGRGHFRMGDPGWLRVGEQDPRHGGVTSPRKVHTASAPPAREIRRVLRRWPGYAAPPEVKTLIVVLVLVSGAAALIATAVYFGKHRPAHVTVRTVERGRVQ